MSIRQKKENLILLSSEDLQNSASRYRQCFNSVREGIIILDAKTRKIIDVNSFMLELLGYERGEFLNKPFPEIGIITDSENAAKALSGAGLISLKTKDGERREAEFVSNRYTENGRRFIQYNVRFTGRQSIEEWQSTAIDALPAHICLLDLAGNILEVNRQWKQFSLRNGFRGDNFGIGSNYIEICENSVGEDAESARQIGVACRDILAGKASYFQTEYPCHSPTKKRWFELTVTAFRKEKLAGAVIMHVDISERKQTEENLQASELRYRQLFESNPNPAWVYDVETLKFLAVNEKATRHYGYTRKEFQELTLKDIRPPEDIPLIAVYHAQIDAGVHKIHSVRHQKKDGTLIEVDIAIQPINFAGRAARLALIVDVTERRKAEKELQDSQQFLKTVIDTLPQAIWWKDRNSTYLGCNRFLADVAGLESSKDIVGLSDYDMPWKTEEADFFRECDRRVMETGQPELNIIEPLLKHDGEQTWLTTNKVPFRNADGEIIGVIGTFADITDQRRANAALRESEYKFRTLLKSMREGLLQVDNNDCITFVNDRFCEMVDYTYDALMGTNWSQLIFNDDKHDFVEHVNKRRREGLSDSYELCLRKKSGDRLWVIVGGAPALDAEGAVIGSIGVFTDITERKRAEEQLFHDALHDGLTGLANRTLFIEHLQLTIERAKRNHEEMFAVLFLDFDRFKVINDSLGHLEGDNLLKQIAQRLESSLRAGDLVARLGGDEFTVLVNHINDPSDALRVVERIQKSLQTPFKVGDSEIFISASIGIALSTTGHARAEDMLRNADIAMYRAKDNGRAQHQVFDQAMHELALRQLRLETEMRQALEREEFQLHYQPIIDLETNALTGFESLVRWNHPQQGMIPPFEFIRIAEDNNLILPLGKWILEESCRQLRHWHEKEPAASHLTISVNLSSKQFRQANLVDQIAEILKKTGLKPRYLKLEITESHIMENTALAVETMSKLRQLGVELSLDDFGTGYSSLSYLHRLPVTHLKIDRSFVTRMIESKENSEIIHTIIKLAQNLKMKVVAEGIETGEQLARLRILNCEYGQGYLFARPMDSEAAGVFIDKCFGADFDLRSRAK